jgi:hypothetical protein
MAEAVPSRRIATALRDLHRARLQLIDTHMKAQVRVTEILRLFHRFRISSLVKSSLELY